jgi:hypothetical protein
MRLQQRAQTLADNLVIVRNQDSALSHEKFPFRSTTLPKQIG